MCIKAELPNCEEIDQNDNEKCSKCSEGYWLMLDTYECKSECPDGYTEWWNDKECAETTGWDKGVTATSWLTYSTTVVTSTMTAVTSLFFGSGARMWININAIQF